MASNDEARNVAPPAADHAFWAYVSAVIVAGFALLAWQLTLVHLSDLKLMGAGLIVVAVMVLIGEVRPLIIAGSSDVTGVTTSTTFTFALLLHTGLPVALLLQACATIVAALAYRRALWRTGFNVAQFTLSYTAAGIVLLLFHRHATATHMLNVSGSDLPVIALAGLVYFAVNNLFVSAALAARSHTSIRHEFFLDFGFQSLSNAALLGLSPIVVVVIERGPSLVPLLLFPLAAVYATASMTRARERESLHDELTGLPNRKLLVERTNEAVRAASESGSHVGLFLLDLDRFKEINDTLGHRVGDELLQLVGRRLTAVLRPGDVIARLGGDEFAMLVPNLEDPQAGARPGRAGPHGARRAVPPRRALTRDRRLDRHRAPPGARLRLRDAAAARGCGDVRRQGAGTGVQVYSTEIDRHSTTRLGMVAELRGALERRELELHYQPKADLRTGDVVGVEALLRWRHAERGMVPPDDFLPLAEQTGLMRVITKFVLDEALQQLSAWWRMGLRIHCAVNVSARDLYDRGFAELLKGSIEQYDVPPRALMIEVTESSLMADPARAASTLLSLADLGVGVSLDDFGTGYSSLVHLKRLPVSEVKIDRSFVMRMDVNEDDAAIVRSIIDLAGALGLRTVAEGVETRDAWDRLAVYGCDAAQGWYLAKAMPADIATAWLQDVRHVGPAAALRLRVGSCLRLRRSASRAVRHPARLTSH